MKLSQQQALFTQDVARLILWINASGFMVTLGEAMRSPEQAALYAKQGKGIQESLHCKRLAIDLNLFESDGTYLSKTDSYKEFGDYWEQLSPQNRWGGKFSRSDGNHFERREVQS